MQKGRRSLSLKGGEVFSFKNMVERVGLGPGGGVLFSWVLRGLLYKTVERKINLKSFQHLLKYSHMTESFSQSLMRIYFTALKKFSNTDLIKGDAQVLKYLILCYTISKLKFLEFPWNFSHMCHKVKYT